MGRIQSVTTYTKTNVQNEFFNSTKIEHNIFMQNEE